MVKAITDLEKLRMTGLVKRGLKSGALPDIG